jgi:hypothetical protein
MICTIRSSKDLTETASSFQALSNHTEMILFFVMAGLVPAIHVFLAEALKLWMPGTTQGMTRFARKERGWPGQARP